MIEAIGVAKINERVVNVMRNGKDAIKAANDLINVCDIDDLKEELYDIMAENAERGNFLTDFAKVTKLDDNIA